MKTPQYRKSTKNDNGVVVDCQDRQKSLLLLGFVDLEGCSATACKIQKVLAEDKDECISLLHNLKTRLALSTWEERKTYLVPQQECPQLSNGGKKMGSVIFCHFQMRK
ncbi:hypothetical protein E2C01_024972 [Portunus trituberculatus]|uniref:Uncharacterized protein n=1 Tax=Portunus trituberculatus TaxID=210409 RepID=A0A5B7EEB7_PORTR|nr:hypothetical protein [Portunus trituberculatus]